MEEFFGNGPDKLALEKKVEIRKAIEAFTGSKNKNPARNRLLI